MQEERKSGSDYLIQDDDPIASSNYDEISVEQEKAKKRHEMIRNLIKLACLIIAIVILKLLEEYQRFLFHKASINEIARI